MKYIEKKASPQAFERWKESKKNRQEDLAKIKDLTPDLTKQEATTILTKLKIELTNTLHQPLKPFVQVLVRLLEKNYIR